MSTDEIGTERFDSDPAGSSGASGPDRFYRLPGGCVTYDYSVPARTDPELTAAADAAALGFLPRDELVAYVHEQAGQPCPYAARGRPARGPLAGLSLQSGQGVRG